MKVAETGERCEREREKEGERDRPVLASLSELVGVFVASSIVTPRQVKEAYKKCIWHLRIYV